LIPTATASLEIELRGVRGKLGIGRRRREAVEESKNHAVSHDLVSVGRSGVPGTTTTGARGVPLIIVL
jgi:hypothetical protein